MDRIILLMIFRTILWISISYLVYQWLGTNGLVGIVIFICLVNIVILAKPGKK